MARKAKKKSEAPPPPPPADDDDNMTEEESVGDDAEDAEMDSGDDGGIPDIVDKESGDEDDGSDDDEEEEGAGGETEAAKGEKETGSAKKEPKKKKNDQKAAKSAKATIPFLDTFYQMSSEDSPRDRSVAARDMIRHCFLSEDGPNPKDAAYALTRLMNGLCSGRAASRQGYASCLASYLRVAYSSGSGGVLEGILREDDDYAKKIMEDGGADPAAIVRGKLLATTQFDAQDDDGKKKGGKKGKQTKNRFGGKMKGIEERDHVFGRLFGILAVIRSGILVSEGFPTEVSFLCCSQLC